MAEQNVTLVFEDERSITVSPRASETVYQAAARNKLQLEHDCLEGACGTCKALCTAGQFSLRDYVDDALSRDERESGHTLLCQTVVQSDCVFELPYESARATRRAPMETRQARVHECVPAAKGVMQLDLQLEGDARLGFLPGQYVHLHLPHGVMRSYSMASAPGDQILRFYVKLLAGGAMSEWARSAKAGDPLQVTGPYGHFYFRRSGRPLLLIAGGTGLAPMLSMLAVIAAQATPQPSVQLLYGAASDAELFGAGQLTQWVNAGVPLTLEHCVVTGGADWRGAVGHITSLLRAELLSVGECDAYLCGPPAMIDAARGWLQSKGVQPDRVYSERFVAS